MSRNFTAVGNEIQVNINGPVNNFIGNDQDDADVAALSDGRFFVVYTHEFIVGDDDIIGQFVNPDGTTSGTPVEIQYVGGNQQSGAVAQRSGGAAVVVWHDVSTSDEIHYSIISNLGGVGAETTILNGNSLQNPDVATFGDGRSIVVAQQNNATADIVFRLIDDLGAPVGAQAAVDDGAGGQFEPAVAAFGSNALVVYQDNQSGTNDIAARFFNGTSFGAEVIVADIGNLIDADVAALSDGRFVVVWENDDNDDVEGRLLDASGVPIGAVFTVSNQGGDNENVRVAALPGGGFIAMWQNDGGNIAPEINNNNDAILGRRFDGDGAPAGDLFLVNAGDPDDGQVNVAVAVNSATGQAFAAWDDNNVFTAPGDTDPLGVRGHAFLATIDVVNGTTGDDIIQTFSLSEPINGLAGDDTIFALGGNDIVHGNSGADLLVGGLGDDQLFGDGGADRLERRGRQGPPGRRTGG